MKQIWEDGKKPNFGSDLGLLGQDSGRKFFQKSGFVSQ